jgi:hypothetical protein
MRLNTKFRKTRDDLRLLMETSPAAAKAISIEFAGECVSEGKERRMFPFRTGNLASTARVLVEGKSVSFATGGIVGNPSKTGAEPVEVNYAQYVNNGTSRQSPQFFMERIVNVVANKPDADYKKILKSWLNQIKR